MKKNYLDRMNTLNRLIRIKGTGTPQQLAKKMEISERTLYDLLTLMKDMGAPICYCRHRLSYYYEEDGEFCVKFVKK